MPGIQFGPSSLRIFKPSISVPTWLGRKRPDRRVPIYNYFNRIRAPLGEPYSVRATYARDWRGGRWTYDGHLGTDFAVPIGTQVVSAAPGIVLRVGTDWTSGGLKICIDHGGGLLTTSNHLSAAFVRAGDPVGRATPIGRSGASGAEFVLFFPWISPHLHFNVWLDGHPVDPFSRPGEVAVWRGANEPLPAERCDSAAAEPSSWDEAGVKEAIAACKNAGQRARLEGISELPRRATELLLLRNYRSALFDAFPAVYRQTHERAPRLDLPFAREDFEGVAHPPYGSSQR